MSKAEVERVFKVCGVRYSLRCEAQRAVGCGGAVHKGRSGPALDNTP